jgi:hypothetical protein
MNQIHSAGRSHYSLLSVVAVMAALALFPFAGKAYAHENDGAKSNSAGSGVEVTIGANGATLVRGAKVTSVSGSQVNANTNYGSSILNWIVKTDGNTNFTANKGTSGLAEIAVGDIISFSGSLDQAASGLAVNAKVVKDWTQVTTKKSYSGIVTSINATLNSFTLSHDKATTTVQTNSATTFKLSNGNTGSFVDLFLNAKVKVMGMFNASSSVFTATSIDVGTTTKKNDDGHGLRDWFRGNLWLKIWNR